MHTSQEQNSAQNIAEKIGRFGLQNSADVVAFLESPAGIEVQDKILEQLALAEVYDKQITAEIRTEQRQHDLMVMLFLLGLMYEEEAEAKAIIDTIIKDSEKLLTAHQTTTTASTNSQRQEQYEKTITQLQQQVKAQTEEQAAVNKEIEKANDKYETYDAHIDAIEGKFESHTVEELGAEIQLRVVSLEEQFNNIQDDLDAALKSGDDEAVLLVQKRLNNLNGLQLQIETLKDIQAVKAGTKEIYTEDGQPKYCHDTRKQLIKKDGEYFLLNKGEPLEGNENKGRASFKNAEPSLLSVRSLLDRNKGLEITAFAERQQKIDLKGELLQKSLAELQVLKQPKMSPALSKAACTTPFTAPPKPTPPSAIIPTPETNNIKELFERLSSANVTRQDAQQLLALVKDNPGIRDNARLSKALENMVDRTPDSTTLKTTVKDRLCFLQIMHNNPALLANTNAAPKVTNWPPKPKDL